MSILILDNKQIKIVPREKAERIQRCIEGEAQPANSAQARYIAHVRRVYLNLANGEYKRREAPPVDQQALRLPYKDA